MSEFPPPPPLKMQGDISKNWKLWKQMWDAHATLTDLQTKPMGYQVAKFITTIGPDALEIHNSLPFENEADKNDMEKILDQWQRHCVAATNVIFERYTFNKRIQAEGETFDSFLMSLRQLSHSCEFGPLQDDLIRDRIVCGIRDESVRKRLLQEANLTLARCITTCKAAEISEQQLNCFKQESVHQVRQQNRQKNCKYCGGGHKFGKANCPAAGHTCKKCGRANHYEQMCLSSDEQAAYAKPIQRKDAAHRPSSSKKTSKPTKTHQRRVHQVEEEDYYSDEEIMSVQQQKGSKVMLKLVMQNGEEVRMHVDSGASCNVIPEHLLPSGCKISSKTPSLKVYGGSSLDVVGCTMLKLTNPANNQTYNEEFVVVRGNLMPLLGLPSSLKMQVIDVCHDNIAAVTAEPLSLDSIKSEYNDVFTGLGDLGELTLEVDQTVKPQIMPPRRVSLAVRDQLKEEIQRLEGLGIIRKVTEPTDWVSSLVVTRKSSGKIRVCLDPVHLNKALKRAHYPLPVIEDILPELSDAKVFSRADLKDGFLQVRLSEPSQLLTTFQTPWGRYCWRRLPFGVSPAPECFQQRLDQELEGLPGVFRVADDLLIIGRGANKESAEEDHDHNMRTLLTKLKARNIKLNFSKFELKKDEIPFIGHLLTEDGLKPAPDKVEAITLMPTPEDEAGVRRFLGMTNYLARFCPQLSAACEPLRRLLNQESWTWTESQEKAFQDVKQLVSHAPVLRFFDDKQPLEGQADASSQGLGFCLMQEGQPLSFASRALTPAEQNYAQIEKELLSLVFGLERHHQYTFGRRVVLWTDHRPLVAITRKPLTSAPKRLQRLLLRLLCYDVDVRYQQGTTMYLADTLSRAFPQTRSRTRTEKEAEILCAVEFVAISQPQLQEIAEHTERDPTSATLRELIQRGWPDKSLVPVDALPYFTIRDELSVDGGIIWRGERCVVPKSLRTKIKNRLHLTWVATPY